MPKNWKTYKFQELLAEPVRNGIYKKKEYHGRGARIVNMGELFRYPRLKDVDMKRVELKDREVPKVLLEEGDLIFARRSLTAEGAGKCSIVKEILEPTTFESSIIRARPNRKKADSDFLYYFYNSSIGKNLLGTILRQVAVSGITGSDLIQLGITIPEIKEQRAIANILSALDDKIENNLAMNKTLEDMAMALYKHWFVDFGPFQESKFIDSELGEIPEGWEVKLVKDFGRVITGKTPSKKFPEHFGNYLPFITPTGFKNHGRHILKSDRMISKLGAEKHKKSLVPKNSVIVTCIGSDMGKVALSTNKSLSNQQINSLVTENYLFMYCFFIDQYNLLRRMAGDGTTMPIINKTDFENMKVLSPNKSILTSFEERIQLMDKQMFLNSEENQTLTELRDTLLPKLISGEVRLKEFEKEIIAAL